jgi:ubiquinone/menaquinone biosynthesis C-methylase UbiE
VNRFHGWYCSSGRWARTVRDDLLPWALSGVDLGDDVLELGPGPGLTTDELKHQVPRLTAVEIDPQLADQLRTKLAGGNVEIVTADATRMPFADGRFSGAVSFTMLHHVPSRQLQDALLAEVCRVLRPGGVFAGSDSTTGPLFRLAHAFDTMVLVDPAKFAGRLAAAGFVDPQVQRGRHAFRFRAARPANDSR